MRESSKAALCGIAAGLAVVIMMSTYLSPLLQYTAPPVAGLLIMLITEELGKKWATGVFFSISLLSVFLIADKESAVFFTLFFGWYPAVKPVLDEKIKMKPLRMFVKLVIYCVSLAAAVSLCAYVFNIDYSEFGEGGTAFMIAFLAMFLVLLCIYDLFIAKMLLAYRLKFQKRLRKMFRK